MNRLIIGCGYLGKKVALALRRQGVDATGVVRSEAGVSALAALGIEALRVDLDDPDTPPLPLSGCELFYFAPPPRSGIKDSRVARLLAACDRQGAPRRIVYLSTTGVYGDCAGDWWMRPGRSSQWRRGRYGVGMQRSVSINGAKPARRSW